MFDPDMLVGPVAGRFVNEQGLKALSHIIKTVFGFDDFYVVLVAVENDLS